MKRSRGCQAGKRKDGMSCSVGRVDMAPLSLLRQLRMRSLRGADGFLVFFFFNVTSKTELTESGFRNEKWTHFAVSIAEAFLGDHNVTQEEGKINYANRMVSEMEETLKTTQYFIYLFIYLQKLLKKIHL